MATRKTATATAEPAVIAQDPVLDTAQAPVDQPTETPVVDADTIVGLDPAPAAVEIAPTAFVPAAAITLDQVGIVTASPVVDLPAYTSVTLPDETLQLLSKIVDQQGLLGIKELLVVFQYADDMVPGVPQPPQTAASRQLSLWKAFEGLLNKDDGLWNERFAALLFFVHHNRENDGAFIDEAVMRFVHDVPGVGHYEHIAYRHFLSMLTVLANPATRDTVKRTIAWARFMEKGVSEEARQRIFSFFGV